MTNAQHPAPRGLDLGGKRIGISISDSADLGALGMNDTVVKLAYVEMTRHLLAHGATVAYGGDHREEGFAQVLFDLVQTYARGGPDLGKRTINYLAWPLHLTLKKKQRTKLLDVATIVAMPLEDELKDAFGLDPKVFLNPDTTEHRYVWARCLTRMRERMRGEIDVRLVLGGQTDHFKGRYPGIAEEALLSLGKPIYLLGGFGGCARDLIEAVDGKIPERLTRDYQCGRAGHHKDYKDLYDDYNARHGDDSIDYGALCGAFAEKGVAGLANGLGEAENRTLFATDDIDEMIALVLRGLVRLG
jgi:hypothetical protein